ncbi:MAG TPA: hypothetical protein PLZ12_12640 [Saprospiraceae bacterium]|nr:hypothetical protein [Saprospiraceae bacterium]
MSNLYPKNIDRKFRLPRIWSNLELKKFAHLFGGEVVNVSAWKDSDKEGRQYKDYFINAISYSLTNYNADARGFQGIENEIFLDLTAELPTSLHKSFDVAFNHTTLEHIFEVNTAFDNICKISRDIVIIVVPFLQEMHGEYGDYWRFTPSAIIKMFERNKMEVLHLSFNKHPESSVYIFAIASHLPEKWVTVINGTVMKGLSSTKDEIIGNYAFLIKKPQNDIINSHIKILFKKIAKKIKK